MAASKREKAEVITPDTDVSNSSENTDSSNVRAEETPEEARKRRIIEQRNANLQKAIERGREAIQQRKAEREALKEDKIKLQEMQKEVERAKIAAKWARLEKEKARAERSLQKTASPHRPVGRPRKKPAATLDSETESDSEEEVMPVRRPRSKKVVEKVVVHDPVATMSTAQIREDLRKMQLEMMAKQLWGNM